MRRFELLVEATRNLLKEVSLPDVDLPQFGLPHFETLRTDDVEAAAQASRRHFGLGDGPISNMVQLLENKGVVLARAPLAADHLDSFSAWAVGRPFIVINSAKLSAVRCRLDAAHELAHLLLHGGSKNDEDPTLRERQAFQFGAAFLLPAGAFINSLTSLTLSGFELAKPYWKVSIAAMITRASTLRLLSETETRNLWISYSRRGYRSGEPLDGQLPVESPRLLARSVEVLLRARIRTFEELAFELGLPTDDYAELLGVKAPGGDAPIEPRPIRTPTGHGRVVPFRRSGG